MIRIVCAFIAFFTWHAAMAGEIRSEAFLPATLGHGMRYAVYLPDGYACGQLHYPVLYLLQGAGGDERA